MAHGHGVCELIWIWSVMKDLNIEFEEPMRIYCGNKSTISIIHNHVHHGRNEHVEVDRHFIKEKLDADIISRVCAYITPTG